MSADIGPGDFVECLCGAKHPCGGDSITKGSVYVVRGITPGVFYQTKTSGFGILLVGVRLNLASNGAEHAWNTNRFRKIYRPKPDAFTDLLKVPDRKRVKV